jgi:hypothetical protein
LTLEYIVTHTCQGIAPTIHPGHTIVAVPVSPGTVDVAVCREPVRCGRVP